MDVLLHGGSPDVFPPWKQRYFALVLCDERASPNFVCLYRPSKGKGCRVIQWLYNTKSYLVMVPKNQ
jgi:hypothetical protein